MHKPLKLLKETKMQKGFLVFAILLGFMLTASPVAATTDYNITIDLYDSAGQPITNVTAGGSFWVNVTITSDVARSHLAKIALPPGFEITPIDYTSSGYVDTPGTWTVTEYNTHSYDLEYDSLWYSSASALDEIPTWKTNWSVTAPKETGTYTIAVRAYAYYADAGGLDTIYDGWGNVNTSSITVVNSTPLTVTEDRTRHGFGETVIISGDKATNAIVNVTIINPLGFISNKSSNSTAGTTWQVAYRLNETIDYAGIYDVEVLAENSTGDGFAYVETTFRVGNKSKRKFPHLEFFCTQCHENNFINGSPFVDSAHGGTIPAAGIHPDDRAFPSINPDFVHTIHDLIPEFNETYSVNVLTQPFGAGNMSEPGRIQHFAELDYGSEETPYPKANPIGDIIANAPSYQWQFCTLCHINVKSSLRTSTGNELTCSQTGDEPYCHVAEMKGAHKDRPSCTGCHGEEGGKKPSCSKCHDIDYETETLEESGSTGQVASAEVIIRSEAAYREEAYSEIRYKVDYTITDTPATGTNTLTLYYLAADEVFYSHDTRTHDGSGSGWINTTDLLLEDPPIAQVEDYYQIKLEFTALKTASLDYTAYFNYSAEDRSGVTNDTHYGIDCLTCHGHSHEVRNPYCTECHTEMEIPPTDGHYKKMDDPDWQAKDHTAYYEKGYSAASTIAVNPKIAQAFKVYGAIDAVRVDLRFNRTGDPQDNITVTIRDARDGAILANGTKNSTTIVIPPNITNFTNGGFEEGDLYWTATSSAVFINDSVSYSGQNSTEIEHGATITTNYTYQTATVLQNKNYTLEGYIKTVNVSGARGAQLRVNGTGIDANTSFVNGTSGWTYVETIFNTSTATSVNVFAVLNNSNGTAWFDDISLGYDVEEVEETWESFNLIPANQSPTRLNSSQTYYLQINRTGGTDSSNYMSIYRGSTSLYEDGNAWNWTGTGWVELSSWDLDFAVYHDTSCTDCHGGREREPVFQVPTCYKCHNQTAIGVLETNTDVPPYGLEDMHGRANWSCSGKFEPVAEGSLEGIEGCHGERHNKTTVICENCHNTYTITTWNGTHHVNESNRSQKVGWNYTIEDHAFNESGWHAGPNNQTGATCLQCHDNATVNVTGNAGGSNVYTGEFNMQTLIHSTTYEYMSRNCTAVCHRKNISGTVYPYNSANHKSGADNNCSQCHYRPGTDKVPAYHSKEITSYWLVLWMTSNDTSPQGGDHIEINVSVNNTMPYLVSTDDTNVSEEYVTNGTTQDFLNATTVDGTFETLREEDVGGYGEDTDYVADYTNTTGTVENFNNMKTENDQYANLSEGSSVATTDYDYVDYTTAGHTAYKSGDAGAIPPAEDPENIPGQAELTSAEYDAIKYDDTSYSTTDSKGTAATHRFKFKITEAETSVTQIGIRWIGQYEQDEPNTLDMYIWNGTNWDILVDDRTIDATDTTVDAMVTSSITDYIDSNGYINWIIQRPDPGSTVRETRTDYVRLNVTSLPYRMNITTNVTDVPLNWDNYTLSIRANATAGETFNVSVRNTSGDWNVRGNISGDTMQEYNITLNDTYPEIQSDGTVWVRFIDNETSDGSQDSLFIDYLRVYSNATAVTNYRLNVTQNITNIPSGTEPYKLRIKGNRTSGDNFDVYVYNFTSSTWNLRMDGYFTDANEWHDYTLTSDEINNNQTWVRYIDDTVYDTTQDDLTLDYVGVRSETVGPATEYSNVSIVGFSLGTQYGGGAGSSQIGDVVPLNQSIPAGEVRNFTFVYEVSGGEGDYIIFSGQAINGTQENPTDESNIYEYKVSMTGVIPEFPLGLVLPIIAPALIYLAMRRKIKLG